MTSPDRPIVNAWEPDAPHQRTLYPAEFRAIMTELLDAEHPLPNKINSDTYTENLTASGHD
jgi:hypothetical protein